MVGQIISFAAHKRRKQEAAVFDQLGLTQADKVEIAKFIIPAEMDQFILDRTLAETKDKDKFPVDPWTGL